MFSLKIITHSLTKEGLLESLERIKLAIENGHPMPKEIGLEAVLWDLKNPSSCL